MWSTVWFTVHSGSLKSLLTLFKTPLESIQRSPYGHYIGLGLVLEFANGAVKAAVSVLGVLEKGGPIVGDLVIFVYTHGHMGWGLDSEED